MTARPVASHPRRLFASALMFMLSGLVGLCGPASLSAGADDGTSPAVESTEDHTDPVLALRETADQARNLKETTEQQVNELSMLLRDLQLQVARLQTQVAQSEQAVASTTETLKQQQETATQTTTAREQADQILAEALAAYEEARKKAEEAQAAEEAAVAVVRQTEEALVGLSRSLADSGEMLASTMQQLMEAGERAAELEETLALARIDWIEKQRSLDLLLRERGEWVSFAEEVAPVLYSRCLACHNARTAQGRLNLESYAALMKGGESGDSVIPGDHASSLLTILIEDGSMPQEADPLTAEQIATISRWIAVGAPLDAGIDPGTPLIQVMPRQPQPLPPETYRVPIPVTAIAFTQDGQYVLTGGYHEVLVWNVLDGSLVQRITNVAERVYDLAVHPDGERIAIASGTPGQSGEVKIFQLSDGALLADFVTVEDAMFAVAFSPDGSRLATCGADRAIRVFDLTTGTQQFLIEDHADWVQDIAWSPDGSRLASASRDKTSKVFDATTGDALTTFNSHGEPVYGVGFNTEGNQVVTAGRDRRIRVWNAADGNQAREIGGFGDEVLRIVVVADNRIFSCGADKVARIHNAGDGAHQRNFEGHSDWIYALDVHLPSGRLVTGSYNGEVRVWDLESGATVTSWIAAPGL